MNDRGLLHALAVAMGVVALVLGGFVLWWWSTTTTDYLRPLSLTYERADICGAVASPTGWCATFIRETPRGEVMATWATEIRVLQDQGETDCNSSGGPTRYQVARNDLVQYPVSPDLTPCLEAGFPLRIIHQHFVRLGPIGLRPSVLDETIPAPAPIIEID